MALTLTETPPSSGFSPTTEEVLIDGRYRVLGRLAQGGMGVVYRAEDVLLQRPAALKVIDPSLAQSKESIDMFRREARVLARLRHDNVVQIYAFGNTGEAYFFAMEYIDGENLDDILCRHREKGSELTLDHTLEIIRKVASGLTAAHSRGVAHRDVKPGNVVIEHDNGRPVIVDFGIARQTKDTHLENPSGTPTYMAPEQIRNDQGHEGDRADQYSLACTAFEMLCGRPPFDDAHPYALMYAHIETPPPLVSKFRPEYQAFDECFARALAKNPKYRYESCVAFAEDLHRASQDVARRPDIGELTLEIDFEEDVPMDEPVATSPRVVILAEDDGVRRSLVREATRSFRKVGFEDPSIDCVSSPRELYDEFLSRRPAVVVLDDDSIDGAVVEVARMLRSLPGGNDMHIVVLTRDMLAERAVWQSVNAKRLSKPLSARALAATLDDLVLNKP